LVQPLEGGRFVTELISNFKWSVGVLEYWKTEHMTNIYRESNPRLTGFSSFGAKSLRPLLHHSNIPPLPGFFKAEPSVCDLALRTRISALN